MELLVHASRCVFNFMANGYCSTLVSQYFHFFLCVFFRYCCWSEINVMNIALSITSFQKTGAISFEISFFKGTGRRENVI